MPEGRKRVDKRAHFYVRIQNLGILVNVGQVQIFGPRLIKAKKSMFQIQNGKDKRYPNMYHRGASFFKILAGK